ncbi:MAG TPA: hypothetical protein VK557_15715 [Pyrinomonadaceae bacterium]|nr:hypothetical protein [Pyrinomonadaceae bacterium]
MSSTRLPGLALIAASFVFLQFNSTVGQQTKQRKAATAKTSLRTKTYFMGKLDGGLAAPLVALLHPSPWKGQSDGVILIPASALSSLTKRQEAALASSHRKGLPIVITGASQQHIDALNKILGIAKTSDLPQGLKYLDFYASAMTRRGFRSYLMAPSIPVDENAAHLPEKPANLYTRTREFLKWINDAQSSTMAMATAPPPSMPVQIYNDVASWQTTISQPVQYYWASCGTPTNSCTNNYTLQVNVWPVYSQTNAENNANPASQQLPTDFFIMSLWGNLSSAGCFGFYNKSHPTRISAYWARQYNLSAAVQDNWPIADLNIASGWSPQAANPSASVTTGTTWSLGGTGTVGFQGSDPTGSVSFNAGVSFNKTATVNYPALQTQPNIGSTSQTLNVASWTYDSWNYVHSTIQPSNGMCGGKGFGTLPPIISNSTFSPQDTWVWQAYPAVRQKYNGVSLPIQIDFSVLLGWTYYPGYAVSCKPKGSHGNEYPEQYGSVNSYLVGTGALQGITFDVGCAVVTSYGTIPLGPTSNQNWNMGNPGTPYTAISSWVVNPPFAPTGAPSPSPSPSPSPGN